MNRRTFLRFGAAIIGARLIPEKIQNFQTRHLIWIINGNGSRKKDWYQNPSLCPNFARLASEGFVYEESFNETVSRHDQSLHELITGTLFRPGSSSTPTPLEYVRAAYDDGPTNYWFLDRAGLKPADGLTTTEQRDVDEFTNSTGHEPYSELQVIPGLMRTFKPRMLIYHQVGHDVAHGNGGSPREETGFSEYLKVCRKTDEQVGRILDFVKNDPYFCRNTSIVVRPEFGRDDELTPYGELHHSTGYYQSHHSAEIWWGPDIRVGVDRTLKSRLDVAPTVAKLFNVDIPNCNGQVHPEMFKNGVGSFLPYSRGTTWPASRSPFLTQEGSFKCYNQGLV